MMITSLVNTVPMARIGRLIETSNEEQNDWRSHDPATMHGVPSLAGDIAPQLRPSCGVTFKRQTQKFTAPAGDPWDH